MMHAKAKREELVVHTAPQKKHWCRFRNMILGILKKIFSKN
jgi:hypothetical protein